MKTISLKLPDSLLERLKNESRSRGLTKSELVRQSLENSLGVVKDGADVSCYDLVSDLVGSIRGLPSDLAIHPKYMDDFGK